jgi:DNA-binding transcriptional ArsR family regulator
MGTTKNQLFTDAQNELAEFAKVLGHPARIAILQLLSEKNQCINGTLVAEIGLAQATISQHLKALKEIGLVKGSIEGVSVSYCIDREKVASLKNQFQSLFETLDQPLINKDCC